MVNSCLHGEVGLLTLAPESIEPQGGLNSKSCSWGTSEFAPLVLKLCFVNYRQERKKKMEERKTGRLGAQQWEKR